MEKPQDYTAFLSTLNELSPPENWPEGLQSLWYDAKGNWEASHDIAQEMHNPLGSWIHGYLHWKEGDTWNAKYWYRQAARPFPNHSLEEEHKEIVKFILQ